MTHKILLVDDDNDILEFISYALKKEGYIVETCNKAKTAVKLVTEFVPDLILQDVMMAEMDGMELCAFYRQQPALNHTVIAFLTARGEDYSQIAGFEAGADDYITKPIKTKVLISRIKALLKRSSKEDNSTVSQDILEFDDLIINKETYSIFMNGKEKNLPKKEFEILFTLASNSGKVFTREEIFSKIWDDDVIVGDRTIDVHVRKLREAIGSDKIQTIKGVGYKFSIDSPSS